jgi:methylated-DNA-protein-cysteine methyltransferase-like protein
MNIRAQLYTIVRQIPAGHVATYGQVAKLAGLPGHARQVGYALSALPEDTDVPWQRVVNAKGEVSPRSWSDGSEDFQRRLLEEEGVVFSDAGRIRLSEFRWSP